MQEVTRLAGKWRTLGFLAAAELLAMALWFSASAVVPQLAVEWDLGGSGQAWMTMSVQIGFVLGALLSAVTNLADRVSVRRLFAVSALLGAIANAAIVLLDAGPALALCLRFVTGMMLAGVYPPGMKLVATWTRRDRGLAIGVLVGALTVGSGLPHLLNGLGGSGEDGMPPWRSVLLGASMMALVAALLVALMVEEGPYAASASSFHWRHAGRAFSKPALRLANVGYLGHMWELYAMWTWVPMMLIASYRLAGWEVRTARLWGFAVVAVGGLGCVLAGVLADRLGRTVIAIGSLVVSGGCCVIAGLFFSQPGLLTAICMVWGFAVVADSAQFSAAVSELADARYVGTALTMQTSMGFLLTLVSIQLVPSLIDVLGWEHVFMLLALGPLVGVYGMARLRARPEARRMASGNR